MVEIGQSSSKYQFKLKILTKIILMCQMLYSYLDKFNHTSLQAFYMHTRMYGHGLRGHTHTHTHNPLLMSKKEVCEIENIMRGPQVRQRKNEEERESVCV